MSKFNFDHDLVEDIRSINKTILRHVKQGAKMYVSMAAVLTGNYLSIIFLTGNIFDIGYCCRKNITFYKIEL